MFDLDFLVNLFDLQIRLKFNLFWTPFRNSYLEEESVGSCYYCVTGKAINTLSKYEEQERRHLENASLQKKMLYLTFAIIIVGVLQAYITYIKS